MSRRPPQAHPRPCNGAACCPGKLNDGESKQDISEQEDTSIKPKKNVQLGIISFFKKKEKKQQKCGQGHPWKPPPTPTALPTT